MPACCWATTRTVYPDNLPDRRRQGRTGRQAGLRLAARREQATGRCAQLVTNTGWGTGLDIRPNPGIGHPLLGRLLPYSGHPAAEHPRAAAPYRTGAYPGATAIPGADSLPGRAAVWGTALRRQAAVTAVRPGVPPRHRAGRRRPVSTVQRPPAEMRQTVKDNLAAPSGGSASSWWCACSASFALLAIFAQLRFRARGRPTNAEFTNVYGSGERQLRPHRRRRSRQGQRHLASSATRRSLVDVHRRRPR